MNTHTSEAVLAKIKKENIKPKAKWYFLVKHSVLWLPGCIVTILGGFSVAGALYAANHSGWEYREFIYKTDTDFFFDAVPFLWIFSFAVFGSLIVKALRTTHKGYKLSIKVIFLSSFIISLLLGVLIYFIDDKYDADSFIRYPVHAREKGIWFSPEKGRIAGLVENIEGSVLTLRDKDDKVWNVDISGFSKVAPFVKKGESIRVLGTSTEELGFVACEVFPWEIGGFKKPPNMPFLMHGEHPKPKPQNNTNPDCKSILSQMRRHDFSSERK